MPLHINQMEIIMDSKTFEDIVTAIAAMRAKAIAKAAHVAVDHMDYEIAVELVAQELDHIAEELRADD